MGRAKISSRDLKARLENALAEAREAGVEQVNLTQLARAAGMSPNNLRDNYMSGDPEFPVLSRGAEGRDYNFDPVAALSHMVRRCDEKIETAEKAANLFAQQNGLDVCGEPETNIVDLRHRLAMSLTIRDEMRNDGQWISRTEVSELFAGYNEMVISFLTSERARRDPNGLLGPEISAAIDADMADLAAALNRYAMEFLNSHGDASSERGRNIRRN
jgi:hypothetical protein